MRTKGFPGPKTNNQRGQFAIEAVLLMLVLVGAVLIVTQYIQKRKLLINLVQGPMKNVQAMTAFGTWKSDGCKAASGGAQQTIGKCHPNSIARSLSSDPE